MALQLDDLASVRQFAEAFKSKYQRLDVLVNNAGLMAVPLGKTKDGVGMHIGVNYLGHYALTGLLLPLIKQTPGCRVIAVSSEAEKMGNIEALLADFDYEKTIAHLNNAMFPEIETVLILSKPELSSISSTIVREIIRGKGKVDKFVPAEIVGEMVAE